MSADFLRKDMVYVNSANRISGSTSDFSIDLSQQIKPMNDYDSASLLSFTCPKSYYLISSTNNSFIVDENGSLTTITIPVGNYTFTTLATTLTTLLSACSWTYVVSNNIITGKYTFTVTGNTGSQPVFDFSGQSPYAIMGFNKTTHAFVADSLTSSNIVNFQKTNTIELCTDLVKKNLLSVVIPDTTDYSIITYNEYNAQFTSQPLSKNAFTSVRFYLLDGSNGAPLDLNGLDYNFTFVIYKKNNYFQHMIEDKKREYYIKALEEELKKLEIEVHPEIEKKTT